MNVTKMTFLSKLFDRKFLWFKIVADTKKIGCRKEFQK